MAIHTSKIISGGYAQIGQIKKPPQLNEMALNKIKQMTGRSFRGYGVAPNTMFVAVKSLFFMLSGNPHSNGSFQGQKDQ